jgi:NADPH:quinone reductase-like Zn-dependent oxidoreductase
MKAVVIDEFGGPEQLRMAEIPAPVAGPGEVLIRIVCTSVNPVDWKIREGRLQSLFPHRFPLIPGWDAAGTVAGTGADVDVFAISDRVYAYCRKPEVQWGTYAEYVTMTADAVAPMPKSLGFDEAAAIPLVGLTSWQSLFDAAQLAAGQSVLIHAGAGGIGGIAIQLAKHAGATVVTTARPDNHDYVRWLGADYVIDYTRDDFVQAVLEQIPGGVDVAFATVGGEVLRRSYHAVRPNGFLVSIVDQPIEEERIRAAVRHSYVFVSPNGGQLRDIAALIDAGRLRAPANTEMPLHEAATAHRLSQEGHVRGKIVLRVAAEAQNR